MNMDELRKLLAQQIEELDGLEARAKEPGLSDAEEQRFDELLEATGNTKAKMEQLQARQAKLDQVQGFAHNRQDDFEPRQAPAPATDPERVEYEWRGGLAEFMRTVLTDPNDQRLHEYRQQAMGVGVMGGFMVPTQWSSTIRQLGPQDAVMRPRATVIPPGDPPDSAITFPTLDQTAGRDVYSGVTVQWMAEGHAKPETGYRLLEVTLDPNEVAAFIPLTDKLLRNSAAASTLAETLLRRAIIAAEDVAFLRGNGAGQPLGIINHPATIQVARTGFPSAAPGDNYVDLVSMYTACMKDGPLVWVYSPTMLAELMTITDVNGNLIWTTSAREGEPNRILGIPAIENERSPIMGQAGDLVLANLQHYLIKDGSGIFVAASEHVRWLQNQTVIKAFWNVDGQPWLTQPLTLEDGVTQRSPFVQLT